MNLDSYYNQIIKDLGEEKRPRLMLSSSEKTELIQLFESFGSNDFKNNHQDFKKVLCVVCHLATPEQGFQEGFDQLLLNTRLPKEYIPQVFQGVDHHFLGYRQIGGERLDSRFLTFFFLRAVRR